MLTKKEIRRQFAAIGYTASLRKHGLVENALKLFVKRENEEVVGNFNVMSKAHYDKHKEAIILANAFSGRFLDSGEKIL